MSAESIALKEQINEHRARQRRHEIEAQRCAFEESHIRAERQGHESSQAVIQDEIMELEVELAAVKARDALKSSDEKWSVAKSLGATFL